MFDRWGLQNVRLIQVAMTTDMELSGFSNEVPGVATKTIAVAMTYIQVHDVK